MYVFMYVCMYVCLYVCMYMYVCMSPYSNSNYLSSTDSIVLSHYCGVELSIQVIITTTVELLQCGNETTE